MAATLTNHVAPTTPAQPAPAQLPTPALTPTIPAALAAIKGSVGQAAGDLRHAAAQARALLGLPPAPEAPPTADTLPGLVAGLTATLAETVAAFAGLASGVRAWATGPVPPATPTPVPVREPLNGRAVEHAPASRLAPSLFDAVPATTTTAADAEPTLPTFEEIEADREAEAREEARQAAHTNGRAVADEEHEPADSSTPAAPAIEEPADVPAEERAEAPEAEHQDAGDASPAEEPGSPAIRKRGRGRKR